MNLDKSLMSKALAEFTASLMFMMFGSMGSLESSNYKNDNMTMGFNYGMSIMVAYHCFACVSGAHINPCVTVAAIILDKIKWDLGLIYILSQFLGAFVGYGITYALHPSDIILTFTNAPFGVTVPNYLSSLDAFGLEFLLTGTWIFCMNGLWHERNAAFQESASVRVGCIVGGLTVTGGFLTGSSLNPARTLAPAVLNGVYKSIWVYLFGPLLGAVSAAIVCRLQSTLLEGGGGGAGGGGGGGGGGGKSGGGK